MTKRGAVTQQGLITILLVLIVAAVLFGGFGAPHAWGYWGWSPAGLFILVLLLLVLFG